MKDSVISALESMFTIQRWNFLPRIETWVEAENAAYVTHVAYAIGRATGLTQEQLECLVLRALLKSLNKHYMTDISLDVRDRLKEKNSKAWTDLINGTAKRTASIFPRKISRDITIFLTSSPSYEDKYAQIKDHDKNIIENLVKCSQLLVARQECEINSTIYRADYEPIIRSISSRMDRIEMAGEYKIVWSEHTPYFTTIKNLKYLRRWNRINRIVSSNVLGHTFLVSFLAIILSMLAIDEIKNGDHFIYKVVLRSLFHDVPESLTGDIITPVKSEIEKYAPKILEDVEKELQDKFVKSAPSGVKMDIEHYELLKEIDNKSIFSFTSMTKDCDRLAAVLECHYEKASGISTHEIDSAYENYLQELAKSEWTSVKDFIRIVKDTK